MPRLLFEKTGNAIWISHLDLMRLFQRAFKRAGLQLTHTQGFNPRPSVSIALPLSVGVESVCELLDFDLEGGAVSCEEIQERLNGALVPGIQVKAVYEDGKKLKHLAYLDTLVTLEYDQGVPTGACEQINGLFAREEVPVEKRTKSGTVQDQNIIPMVKSLQATQPDDGTIILKARVCCQNPSLNPMQLHAALVRHLPELQPDFAKCARIEIFDTEEQIFR